MWDLVLINMIMWDSWKPRFAQQKCGKIQSAKASQSLQAGAPYPPDVMTEIAVLGMTLNCIRDAKPLAHETQTRRFCEGAMLPAREVKDGEGRSVPCVRFKDLLTVFSYFDHPRCKALRAEMANLATRASTGDEALEKALHVRRQELAPEVRDAMRAGLAGFDDSAALQECLALKTTVITHLQKLLEA
eukprot:g25733.t1